MFSFTIVLLAYDSSSSSQRWAMALLVSIWLYVAVALYLYEWPDYDNKSSIDILGRVTLPGITPIVVLWSSLGSLGFISTFWNTNTSKNYSASKKKR